MRLALAIAVGIHAALFGVSALIDIQPRLNLESPSRVNIESEVPRTSLIEVEPPGAAPIEVEFIEPPLASTSAGASTPRDIAASTRVSTSASIRISTSASTRVSTSASTRISTSSSGSNGSERPGPDHDTTGNPYMRMRGADLGLAGESAERIVAATQHDLPAETTRSGKLENAPNGEAIIHDRVTTMTVERDGHAHFADKPDIDVKLKLPIPHLDIEGMRQDLGNLLTEWYADPYASTKFGRTSDLPNHLLASPGACNEWGSVMCDDPLAPGAEQRAREQGKGGGSIGVGGPADITAYLHRKYVGDPYASRKLKLLDDTRDERVERGAAFRGQQLVRSAELIERNIARAAQLVGHEQRVALFELWDECAEGDDVEGHAGQRARSQVIGWIRAHLPKGSPDAFTDEELAELAARRTSHQPFAPY